MVLKFLNKYKKFTSILRKMLKIEMQNLLNEFTLLPINSWIVLEGFACLKLLCYMLNYLIKFLNWFENVGCYSDLYV